MNQTESDPAEYVAHRRFLLEAQHDQCREFDRAILTATTAAIGVSIALGGFLDKPLSLVPFLVASWFGFGLAALATMLSFRLSYTALSMEVQRMDAEVEDAGVQTGTKPGRTRTLSRLIDCLNWGALGLVVVGGAAIAIFAAANLE